MTQGPGQASLAFSQSANGGRKMHEAPKALPAKGNVSARLRADDRLGVRRWKRLQRFSYGDQ